jgi:oligopeptide/dipeptide ABC transporter ATP-binding protein
VDDVALTIGHKEIVGLVGESGSGKSLTALAIMRLLPGEARMEHGRVRLDGTDLGALTPRQILKIRGAAVAMIFQEPMTSLNPLFRAGYQIEEPLIAHLRLRRAQARARAIELMRLVGIPDAERRVDDYPHQLSGGMRQRVMIAMAMACRPKLLLADEPTTALDVTIQAQILTLINELRGETGMGVLLITHDLGVVAGLADRVVVMYAGQVVEQAPASRLFAAPAHPYARMLLHSVPKVRQKVARLNQIRGSMPNPEALPSGCRFHPRCPLAVDKCRTVPPVLEARGDGAAVRCWRADESFVLGAA